MLSYTYPRAFRTYSSEGFTLIELMIVISIVAILVILAIPAYEEYNIRAKITECIVGAAPAKLGVSEYLSTTGQWPPDMNVAALSTSGVSRYCSGFTSYVPAAGSFQIDVNEAEIHPTLQQVQPQLTPEVTSPSIIAWSCSRGATAPAQLKYLPSTCRGT